jgi:hypothetical protein
MASRNQSRLRNLVFLVIVLLATLTLAAATTQARTAVAVVYASEVEGPEGLAPLVLSYQGRLADPVSGAAKPDGTYQMTFAFYDVESGGSFLWSEIKDVLVKGGLFSTRLGDVTPFPTPTIFDGRALWLGITVGAGEPQASPRLPVSYVAYAMYANRAGTAGTADLAANANQLGGQPPANYAAASHTHDAGAVTSGTLAFDRYSAYGDLANDGRIGAAAGMVAAGLHTHTGADIVDASIGAGDLADGSVTSAKIADGNVANADLGTSSVDSAKIADGGVATADLADKGVTSAKIAAGGVATVNLADASVTSAKIAAGGVATVNLADASVTSAKIADGAVATADLAANSVDAAKIVDSSVANADIQDRTMKIGVPANALNHNVGGLIASYYSSGLRWQSNYTEAAGLAVPRPTDWDGTTDVTMRLWFYPTTATVGYVDWFIRPRAWSAGSAVGDVGSINGTAVYTNQANILKEQLFTIPAARLNTGLMWYITMQRYGASETYRDDVILMSVELSYNAVR